jgi:hypothetical protein
MNTKQMAFLSNIVISLLFVTITLNVVSALPSTYALISAGQSNDQGTRHIFAPGELYVKQTCEHAGGMYKDIDANHYACTDY